MDTVHFLLNIRFLVFNGGIREHFRLRELNVSENKSQESWHIVGLREDGNCTRKAAY